MQNVEKVVPDPEILKNLEFQTKKRQLSEQLKAAENDITALL